MENYLDGDCHGGGAVGGGGGWIVKGKIRSMAIGRYRRHRQPSFNFFFLWKKNG